MENLDFADFLPPPADNNTESEVSAMYRRPIYPPEEQPEKAQQLQDELMNTGSSGDCTGLIPTIPVSSDELDSYAELYSFLPPRSDAKGAEQGAD